MFSNGRRASDNLFRMVVYGARPVELPSRYGLSVGKRVGGAVKRNLVKRRLREILNRLPSKNGVDVVVHAFPSVADAGFDEMRKSIAALAEELKILEKTALCPVKGSGLDHISI